MSVLLNKIAVEMEDGSIRLFDSKAEAVDFLRRPAQQKALAAFIEGNEELVNWIIDVQEDLAGAFESTKIRRVSKAEKKALEKALAAVAAAEDKAFSFLVENQKAVLDSFRWPSVKRGSEEEQKAQIINAVTEVAGGDAELAAWLVDSKDQILEALEAGKVKREVSPKAAEGLARWRAEQEAKKAAAQAAQ